MKKLVNIAAAAGLSLVLAGCYTAEDSVIDQGVTPYETITFTADGDDDPSVLTRSGDGYVTQQEDVTLTMRFAEIGTDIYVVETTGSDGDQVMRLYGGVRLFPEAGRAEAYRMMADEADAGPGLRPCGDDGLCIDDLDAFARLILADIAAGADPMEVYDVTLD